MLKYLLLTLLVINNAVAVLLARYTRSATKSADNGQLYSLQNFILTTEVAKFFVSLLLEWYESSRNSNSTLLTSLRIHIWDKPLDTLKLSIPSILYLIQNTLFYVSLTKLSAPVFQVCYQFRLVATALVSMFIMRRRYSIQQWSCLCLLCGGVSLIVTDNTTTNSSRTTTTTMDDRKNNYNDSNDDLIIGFVSVTVACFCSAFAGVYIEYILKATPDNTTTKSDADDLILQPSLWIRNIQLSFFSVIFASAQLLVVEPKTTTPSISGFFNGFITSTWILAGIQTGGGLLVAAVIKYADNVLKGLATGLSVVVVSVCSYFIFETNLSDRFLVGSFFIIFSVFFFDNNNLCPGIEESAFICNNKLAADEAV